MHENSEDHQRCFLEITPQIIYSFLSPACSVSFLTLLSFAFPSPTFSLLTPCLIFIRCQDAAGIADGCRATLPQAFGNGAGSNFLTESALMVDYYRQAIMSIKLNLLLFYQHESIELCVSCRLSHGSETT